MSLAVEIVTPNESVFSGTAGEVIIPAWKGQMGIYPQHDALLTLLRAGIVSLKGDDGPKRFIIGRGFAEVGPTSVVLLTESCEEADGVDKAKAQEDFAAAQAALATAAFGSEERNQAEILSEHAAARMEA